MTPREIEVELERLHGAGFAWAMACCGRRREEAEDVLQASYLKILDGRAQFEGRSNLRTFLFGVIRRTAAEERRRRALGRIFFAPAVGREGERVREAAAEAPDSDARIALQSALERLSRRQREVLQLVFAMGMTIEEAAAALSLSVGSARTHYDRGKKRLAAILGGARV